MRMIRKQLYIAPEQQRKLHDLAARWNCTEAEVMRAALDRLAVSEDPIERRLDEAGIRVPPDPDLHPLSEEESERLEQEIDAWALAKPEPLRMSDAILEDRR